MQALKHHVGTMLDLGFYLVNATTVLLWLFQNIDHRVLIGLIVLGAVFVLVSLCVLAVSLVSKLLFIPNFLLNFLFRIVISFFDIFALEDSPQFQQPPRPPSNSLRSPSNLLDRLSLGREAALASLANADRRLSLPQSLALNPNQWSELETSSTQLSAIDDSRPEQVAPATLVDSRPPLRRSRRLRHVRIRDPYIYSS